MPHPTSPPHEYALQAPVKPAATILVTFLALAAGMPALSAGAGDRGDPPPVRYSEVADGRARVLLPDGSIYEGGFRDGLFEGEGVLRRPDGRRYAGQFHAGLFHGQGEYRTAKGDLLRGEFRRGVLNGEGEIHFVNGNVYRGGIEAGRMSGEGRLERPDGSVYQGGFVNDRFEGLGEVRYASGNRYVGEFKGGRFHGRGTLYLKDAKGGRKKYEGQWEDGRYLGAGTQPAGAAPPAPPRALNAETVLFHQYPLLARSLKKIAAHRPGIVDLYFVSFGGYGEQDVFMKEAAYTRTLFEERFGARGHSLMLVNNRKTLGEVPLATVTNLDKALRHIARRMDPEEDILFLYLTSHGGRDHALSVRLGDLPLRRLSPQDLARILKASGFKWKVIVISACYSGGFVEALKDDHTMIMTSAREDHTSFGCSDEADFTYFGRALFERALPESATFKEAFARARALVGKWEDEQDYDHSEPQFYSAPPIEAKLAEWRAGG